MRRHRVPFCTPVLAGVMRRRKAGWPSSRTAPPCTSDLALEPVSSLGAAAGPLGGVTAGEGKPEIHRVDPESGANSNKALIGIFSQCSGVNLRILGQPCEFYLVVVRSPSGGATPEAAPPSLGSSTCTWQMRKVLTVRAHCELLDGCMQAMKPQDRNFLNKLHAISELT